MLEIRINHILNQHKKEAAVIHFRLYQILRRHQTSHFIKISQPSKTMTKRYKMEPVLFFPYRYKQFQTQWRKNPPNTVVSGIAQSVQRLATDKTVRGSNPGGSEIFRTCPDLPWRLPSLLYNGYRVFPGGKAAVDWRSAHIPIQQPRLKKEQSYTSTHLWAFVDSSRVKFTFTFTFYCRI